MSELPATWRSVPLGELVFDARKLISPSKGAPYQLWSVPSFANGQPEIVDGGAIRSAKLIVAQDDVLISKINPRINRVWQVTKSDLPQIGSSEWLVARIMQKEFIAAKYLALYLSSPVFREWITQATEGVTGSHTRAKSFQILRQCIPVPPLDAQQRIVETLEAHLSQLDKALAEMARAKQQSESLVRSWLHAQLSYAYESGAVASLGEMAETRLGKMLDAAKNEGEMTPYLRNANVQWERIEVDDIAEARMTQKDRVELALMDDDVLVCEGGVPGRSAVWKVHMTSQGNIGFQKALHRVRPGERLKSQFLVMVLRYLSMTGQLDRFTTGTTIKHLPQEQLRRLLVPVLSIDQQTKLISGYERLQELVTHASSTVRGLELQIAGLRRSLLYAAFTGRLTNEESIA